MDAMHKSILIFENYYILQIVKLVHSGGLTDYMKYNIVLSFTKPKVVKKIMHHIIKYS